MLPDCLWKHKWNVTSCCWKVKLGTLHTEKNYLLAISTFFHGVEGDEATSTSFIAESATIDASRSSLEALIATCKCRGRANCSTLPTANKTSVCRFLILHKRRGRRGNIALFCSWKSSNWCFQLVVGSAYCIFVYVEGMRTATLYPRQTKYLFAEL